LRLLEREVLYAVRKGRKVKIPTLEGVIGRRLLVNYRVDPAVLQPLLPSGFRCKLVGDQAVAGICLIRLESLRPRGMPAFLGLSSENAAHRIAVEWEGGHGVDSRGRPLELPFSGGHCQFIPRRDTSSRVNAWSGGVLFPGEQHLAHFESQENEQTISVSLTSQDESVRVSVHGRPVAEWPSDSIFPDFATVNTFFQQGAVGYSATHTAGRLHGMRLDCPAWKAEQSRWSAWSRASSRPCPTAQPLSIARY